MNDNPTDQTPTPAEILTKAADVIEARGWHTGDFFDLAMHYEEGLPVEQCPVCVRGAINVAAGFSPDGDNAYGEDAAPDAVDALASFLGCDLDEHDDLPCDFVSTWNDVEANADLVITTLRECAAELAGTAK